MKHTIVIILVLMTPASAFAECMAYGFLIRPGDRQPPKAKYRVIDCVPAVEIIEPRRAENPLDYAEFQISDDDKALLIEPVNWTAEAYLGGTNRYWAYEGSCSDIKLNKNFTRVEREILCCDILPLRSVQCGLGGTKVLSIKYNWFG